jgi:nucleotide-binding universal stress UspA family protein
VPSSQQRLRVLVPLDGSPVGEAALEFLTTWWSMWPIEPVLLRVLGHGALVLGWYPAFAVQPLDAAAMEAELKDADDYLAGLAESLAARGFPASCRVVRTTEPVARAILDAAEREQVDSIAMGTHEKGGLARLVRGSVPEDVLEHSPVPVLLVHHQKVPAPAGADGGGARGAPLRAPPERHAVA